MLKIAIITNVTKDIQLSTAQRVADFLCGKAEVYMSRECTLSKSYEINYIDYEEIFKTVDIAIVIGGDGTLLRVASRCAKNDIPALGINLGKIGFLTEVDVADVEKALSCIIDGRYIIEKRMLLRARINDEDISCHALNDIVISKPEKVKLIDVDLYNDTELVYHYRADGLIIATPTGSTGYSISAGGPVVDPRMDLYIATPICAHMLCTRSAIMPTDGELTLKLSCDGEKKGAVMCADGEQGRLITADDVVRISKSDYEFKLIKIGKSSFYDTLMNKLS